jgi:hypothetical protein
MGNNTRTGGGLIKMGITVTPEQHEGVAEVAREEQISVAAVIRMAIRHELERRAQDKRLHKRAS